MAKRKTPYLGKAKGCQLLEAWLAEQQRNLGSRAFYEKAMKASPHLVPCPQHNGWWIYREACDFCLYAVRSV